MMKPILIESIENPSINSFVNNGIKSPTNIDIILPNMPIVNANFDIFVDIKRVINGLTPYFLSTLHSPVILIYRLNLKWLIINLNEKH